MSSQSVSGEFQLVYGKPDFSERRILASLWSARSQWVEDFKAPVMCPLSVSGRFQLAVLIPEPVSRGFQLAWAKPGVSEWRISTFLSWARSRWAEDFSWFIESPQFVRESRIASGCCSCGWTTEVRSGVCKHAVALRFWQRGADVEV